MKKEVFVSGEYITLGQLLKEESIISSGGQAKWYLKENAVSVNDEPMIAGGAGNYMMVIMLMYLGGKACFLFGLNRRINAIRRLNSLQLPQL